MDEKDLLADADFDDFDGEDVDDLSFIVRQEAHRLLNETHLEPDPELVAQGWERRFMGDGQRVREAIELYEAMGFEVHAVPVRPVELSDDCDGCRVVVALRFHTIYTRRAGNPPAPTVGDPP